MNHFHFIILSLVLPLCIFLPTASAQPRLNWYRNTCLNVESIVRRVVANKFQQKFVNAQGILRFFHDCFVLGRNAWLALDGLDTDTKAKDAVHSEPNFQNQVSCADILAMAARDVVSLVSSLLLRQCSRCQWNAQTFGNDDPGCARGMGDRVSKTAIEYLDPYKKALHEEQELRMILEAQVRKLEKRLANELTELRQDIDQIFVLLSRVGTQMRSSTEHRISQMQSSTEHGISPQARQNSHSQSAHFDQTTTHTRSPTLCKLQHPMKKNVVAYGRLKGTESLEKGFYRIVLYEIVDGSVDLFDGKRKLKDLMIGDVLDWLIIRTVLY